MGCGSVTKAQNMMNVGRSSHSRESFNWALAAAAAKIINFFLKAFWEKGFRHISFLWGRGNHMGKEHGEIEGGRKVYNILHL